jgi:tRNA pseudouridine55 synthase
LDPLATGLLPLCLGEATKFAGGLLAADKTYEAVIRLGTATDSGDAEGIPTFHGDPAGAQERLDAVLEGFLGEIWQTPPMHSAIKHKGRPLYEYARQGEHIERSARQVRIHALTVFSSIMPDIALRVVCSKGTYIRSLAHDIGVKLGCGAHLVALRRTRIAGLELADAVRLDVLENADEIERWSYVRGADLLVSHLPAVFLPPVGAKGILQGKVVGLPDDFVGTGEVRLYDEHRQFLGLGLAGDDGKIVPKRMCSQAGVALNAALA